jgi:hypothetical protein
MAPSGQRVEARGVSRTLRQRRQAAVAIRRGDATARGEAATGRQRLRLRQNAWNGHRRLARHGSGLQQGERVWVSRRHKQGARRAALHGPAGIEHMHAVGVAAHQGQVVADQEHRHVTLTAQAGEQVEDLQLQIGIEAGGRLVGDEQRR